MKNFDPRSRAKKETATELTAALTGLSLVVAFAPLSSPRFAVAMTGGIAVTVLYAVITGLRDPEKWEEWGFLPHSDAEEDGSYGCISVGWLALISVGFLILAKFLFPLPHISKPMGYFLWCCVQDFLFFGVILRGFLLRMNNVLAVIITALLFAASHYPLTAFMGMTGIVALFWGFVYVKTRWLLPIIVSHWLLGILLLGG